jgi:hypothetical protein
MGTVLPLVREFEGLTISLSDSATPVRISDCAFWFKIHHDSIVGCLISRWLRQSERLQRVGRYTSGYA